MNIESKLLKIMARCKFGVYLSVNRHRDYYESVEKFLAGQEDIDCHTDTIKIMIERNTVVEFQFYPDNAVASYSIFHYDVEKALDLALEILFPDS